MTSTMPVTEPLDRSAPWRGDFVECAACAYEPPRFVPRMRCPKCFGFRTFHRVACAGPVDGRRPERAHAERNVPKEDLVASEVNR